MGSRIAAHLANAGIPSGFWMSQARHRGPQRACETGYRDGAKQRPGAFFSGAATALITPGNFEDDLPSLSDCDWIIEAVTEKLDIKRQLWKRVSHVRQPDAWLSSNTSGIPLARIAEGFPEGFRCQFLGTHFFNPPRYLHWWR